MRRNDLTSDELRFQRLLRSLDRGPIAPDPEFLRRMKETTTAAFVMAQPPRTRAVRGTHQPPPNLALGRRRLRALRVALLSSVASVLLIGMLSHTLFPTRGIELRVALDNLKRAQFAEIEVQNSAGSNTMLFAQGGDAGFHWRLDYASGNSEVSDGTSTYFLNRAKNSVHPSPLEDEQIASTFVEDRLLASLNVNGRAVQSSLMRQRPETQVDQNGQRLYHYNFQVPDKRNVGETLTVNATVNAVDNTLVAMNSEVLDAAGNSKFKANADIKSLNAAIPIDRFQIDPQAASSEQIALVEDVQGEAVVDDLTAMTLGDDGVALQSNVINRAANGMAMGRAQQFLAEATQAPPLLGTELSASNAITMQRAAVSGAPYDRKALAGEKPSFKTFVQPSQTAAEANSTNDARGPVLRGKASAGLRAEENLADNDLLDTSKPGDQKVVAGSRLMRASAPASGEAEQLEKPVAKKLSGDRGSAKMPAKESAAKDATPNEKTLSPASAPPAPLMRAVAAPAPVTSDVSATADVASTVTSPAGPPSAPLNVPLKGEQRSPQMAFSRSATSRPAKQITNNDLPSELADSTENATLAGSESAGAEQQTAANAMDRQLRKFQPQEPVSAGLNGAMDSAPAGSELSPNFGRQTLKLNVASNSSAFGSSGRGSESYGLVRRRVAAQTELHPGGVLKTEAESANVVWVHLANDADLIVGPGSEVLLLKPTEVRLQAGELMLNVPPGDQVDLLGPEPAAPVVIENSTRNAGLNPPQRKFETERQLVTGRGVFRIENSQLQRLDSEPVWLANYFAKQVGTKQNSPSFSKQASPTRKTGEAEPEPRPEPK